jgi:hypothetical protein
MRILDVCQHLCVNDVQASEIEGYTQHIQMKSRENNDKWNIGNLFCETFVTYFTSLIQPVVNETVATTKVGYRNMLM